MRPLKKTIKQAKRFYKKAFKKKTRDQFLFVVRLLFLSVPFFLLWWSRPTLSLAKLLTTHAVALTTGSEVVLGMDGYYVVGPQFELMIITDCVGWKESLAFLILFVAWPRKKSWARAGLSILTILAYNLLRLDLLMFFHGSFTYFHPAFQWVSLAVILGLWLWSVGKLGPKIPSKRRKKRRKSK